MTTPFLGEIQIYGFPFAPSQWAAANGATLLVQQNATLFSLIGTAYGGNGTTNFQLPNLAGRTPCSQGTAPGLSQRLLGEHFGEFNVGLDTTSIPLHSHRVTMSIPPSGVTAGPTPVQGAALGIFTGTDALVLSNPPSNATLAPSATVNTGGNAPHSNQQPYLAVNFCIALAGAFPSFS